jgi:hypothetical protein
MEDQRKGLVKNGYEKFPFFNLEIKLFIKRTLLK